METAIDTADAADAAPPLHTRLRNDPVTATIIDHRGEAFSSSFAERYLADEWIAEAAQDCNLDARVPVAALITERGEVPLLLLDNVRTAFHINQWNQAAPVRWASGRVPRHAVVLQSDGAVELYNTAAGREDDTAGKQMSKIALLSPDNPQVLMIDICSNRTVLTVVGPGPTNILSMNYWRLVQAGYNPDPLC